MADPTHTRSASRASLARALAWLGVAALALGAWLFLPRAADAGARPALALVLVDVSRSAVAPRAGAWEAAVRARMRETLGAARERGEEACVVAFGREVRVVVPPADASRALEALDAGEPLLERGAPLGADATRLADALDLAATLAGARGSASIEIVGDGTYTGRDPLPAARALAGAGVAIAVTPPGPVRRANVALGPLRVPRALEAGAPLVVVCDVLVQGAGEPGSRAVVELRRDDGPDAPAARVEVPLPAAGTSSIVPVHADLGAARPGAITVEARASLVGADGRPTADAIAEDDVRRARVECGGALVIGVAAADAGGAALFARLRALDGGAPDGGAGLRIVPVGQGDLAATLPALDALVTPDDPLDPREAALVASFVERGGGWLDVAGWDWIARRAAGDGALAAIAALAPARADLGPRDVVLLADASGSMAGAPFESVRAAVAALLDAALPRDDVEVRLFAEALAPPIRIDAASRLDPKARRAFLARLPSADAPHGATRVWSALEALAAERASARRDALVILLSDGQDPDRADVAARGPALRARLESARASLAVVAAGPEPEEALLGSLLPPDETLVSAGDLAREGSGASLARLFARAVARDSTRSAPPPIAVIPAADVAGLAADLARAARGAPPIDRAVRADLAGEGARAARPFWVAADGAPLGAIRGAGAGLVASIAFEPGSEWATRWNEPALLAPLLRALAREHAAAPARSRPALREEDGMLCLENPPGELDVPARARVDAGGAIAEVVFVPAASPLGPRARWCAPIPADLDRASGWWSVAFGPASSPTLVLALPTPVPEELALEARRFHPPPLRAEARAGPTAAPHPLAAWWVAAGAVLLFAAGWMGAFSRPRVPAAG